MAILGNWIFKQPPGGEGIFVLFVHMRNSCIVPLQGLKCSTASMNSVCGWHLVDSSCFCELDFGRKDCPSQHHNRRLERHCMEEQMLSHDGERHESGSQLPGGLDYNQPSPSALGDSEIAKALQMPDQLTRVLCIEGQV